MSKIRELVTDSDGLILVRTLRGVPLFRATEEQARDLLSHGYAASTRRRARYISLVVDEGVIHHPTRPGFHGTRYVLREHIHNTNYHVFKHSDEILKSGVKPFEAIVESISREVRSAHD